MQDAPPLVARVHGVHAPGVGAHAAAVGVLRAGYALRARSRFGARLVDGRGIQVVLERGTILRDGDWLGTEGGAWVRIEAAPEPVVCVTAPTALALLRIVYHLANRHVRVQIATDYLLIEPDPVLERLVRRLGGACEAALLPFDPESGAYEGGQGHGHHNGHDHGDDHADDPSAAGIGELLSIEAHAARRAGAA